MTKHWLALASLLLAAPVVRADDGPRVADERIVLHTTVGDLVLALYPDVAPQTVEQLLNLTRLGVYDTVPFYRIDPAFLVQLANAQSRTVPMTPEQSAAIHRLPAEFSGLRHRRGTVSIAHEDNDPNSGETSFSILLIDAPHLDGKYTIAGRLERGEDVLDAMSRVPRDSQNRPLSPVEVERAEVMTGEQLAGMTLRGPTAQKGDELPSLAMVKMCGALVFVGLVVFLLAGRVFPPQAGSMGLLVVLTGGFGLFLSLMPRARASEHLAVGLFLGVLALFKLMSWFERPQPPPQQVIRNK